MSEIWSEFSKQLLIDSFDICGITSNHSLHTALNFILQSNSVISDYIREHQEEDEIDSFEGDDRNVFDSENHENDESTDEEDDDYTNSEEPESSDYSNISVDDDNSGDDDSSGDDDFSEKVNCRNENAKKRKRKEKRIEYAKKIFKTAKDNILKSSKQSDKANKNLTINSATKDAAKSKATKTGSKAMSKKATDSKAKD